MTDEERMEALEARVAELEKESEAVNRIIFELARWIRALTESDLLSFQAITIALRGDPEKKSDFENIINHLVQIHNEADANVKDNWPDE